MERLQSTWENRVAWNVSESGVHPLRVEEVAETDDERQRGAGAVARLSADQRHARSCARRSPRCIRAPRPTHAGHQRRLGSQLHRALRTLSSRATSVVMMAPNYMQVARAVARALGARVRAVAAGVRRDAPHAAVAAGSRRARARSSRRADAADPDLQSEQPDRRAAHSRGARRHLPHCRAGTAPGCSPTRSTAAPSSTASRRRPCGAATSGPSSRAACRRPTGCPGCGSAGWSRRPALVDELWGVHDYTTIAPGAINDRLAQIALAPARRERLLARTRGIIRTNYPIAPQVDRAPRRAAVVHVPPEAGAIAFVRYAHAINSTRADRAAARREGRARRPGRSLRDGRLPAHRVRRRAEAPDRQPRADRRAARHAAAPPLTDAR